MTMKPTNEKQAKVVVLPLGAPEYGQSQEMLYRSSVTLRARSR